ANNKVIVGTGAGTIGQVDSTSYGRGIWNVADEAAFKAYTNLEASDIFANVLANDGTSSGLDADLLRGTTPGTLGLALLDDANAAAGRTTLELGTAAIVNTGTSGATIPLLNAANTWSAKQIFAT